MITEKRLLKNKNKSYLCISVFLLQGPHIHPTDFHPVYTWNLYIDLKKKCIA